MRIAVTGGTGFVGRYLVEHLNRAGHTCRCLYRSTSDRSGFPIDSPQIEWVLGSMNVVSTDELFAGCDAVVHAALDRPGDGFRGAEGDVVAFAKKNVIATLRLIEAAKSMSVSRFVFVSTCAVHEQILDDRPLDETHPLWPKTHYGAHKAAIEMFVHSYGLGEGYDICALRPSGVYGIRRPIERSKWYGLVRDVVNGQDVSCRGGGKEVHAADVARSVEILLQADGIAGQSYSCSDRYISDHEVAMLAKTMSDSPSVIDGEPTWPRHQIVTEKLRGLGMEFGGDAILRQTIDTMVEQVRSSNC